MNSPRIAINVYVLRLTQIFDSHAEPSVVEYWHRSTGNSHSPFFMFAWPDVVELTIRLLS